MKINEIHKTGMADPEEALESHSRTVVNLDLKVSFAHEQGLEPAFAELLNHGHFVTQLEAAFAGKFKELAQRMIMASKIPPGQGWMDDLETELTVSQVGSQQID